MKNTFFFVAFLLLKCSLFAQNWATVGSAGFSASTVQAPVIAVSGSTVYAAYIDQSVSIEKASVMKSTNGSSWTYVGPQGLTSNNYQVLNISLAVNSSGIPYVAFWDGLNHNVTIMKYSNPSWVSIGNLSTVGLNVSYVNLAFNSTDVPYVAYKDNNAINVQSYSSGTTWSNLGVVPNTNLANNLSFAINTTLDNLFVAYTSSASGYNTLNVQQYSSSWSYVGKPNFANNCGTPSLATSYNNQDLYVLYADGAHSNRATVLHFPTGSTSWIPYLNTGFSDGAIEIGGIAAAWASYGGVHQYMPVVAYTDIAHGSKATVMTLPNEGYGTPSNNWVTMGNPDFSTSNAYGVCVASDNNGNIYVGYMDE